MLLGIKSTQTVIARHVAFAMISVLLVALVWQVNSTWSPDMRLWKSFGGAAFFLLWFAIFIGPAALLFTPIGRLVSYRREAGIWFFVIVLIHGYLIFDGWIRWSVWEFFGYQYFAEVESYLRVESGFGLANLASFIAFCFALVLAATSSDKAVNWLGVSSWKWLHGFAYVIFYLVVVHVVYFAFIHYTPSLNRTLLGQPTNYPDNPLKYYYLFAMISVLLVQIAAFIMTVRRQRNAGW